MLNLAWGGFSNGSASLEAVCVQAVGGIPGDLLEPTTAAAWAGWRNAVHARTGVWLYLDHSDAIPPAFRNIPFQSAAYDRYIHRGGAVASPPGRSNHGWARAIDVTGFENRPDVWQAMNDLAPQFGLSNATGKASGERWHWECTLPPTTTASNGAIPLEDDLSAQAEQQINAIFQAVFEGGTSMPDRGRSIGASLAGIVQSLDKVNLTVTQTVNRGDKKLTQIQDNADTNTMVRNLTAQVGALQQAVAAVAVSQGADPKVIEAAAKAGAEAALKGITLKAVS